MTTGIRTWFAILTGLLLVIGAVAVIAIVRISSADTELTTAHQANTSQQRQISQLRSQIGNLSAKVAGLSVPTDPLANYTDVCNTQATNGSTGVTQTYYYPCTNEAQTIPQPGN
jgi:hypothetical protein